MTQTLDVPYVPTSYDKLDLMMDFAQIRPGQKTADLGSGDGRIVIACAKKGAVAHGFEINKGLINDAKKAIIKEGLGAQAFIHHKNLWDVNLSDFDLVTIYGLPDIMKRLEEKLKKELRPGAKVVSNAFRFPYWEPVKLHHRVYLYTVNPANAIPT